jgi:AcrR family transcriptional regulator
MPRKKALSDQEVLVTAHRLMHEAGPEALTFDALAKACGLSPATLVQRFKTKAGLKRATLMQAWDQLDEKTASLANSSPRTPDGAVEMLVALSGSYGGIEAYAEGLMVLREDFRDPDLRARGAAWKKALSATLDERLANMPGAPRDIGLLLATHWQGSLLWWGFEPTEEIGAYIGKALKRFIESLTPGGAKARPR